MLALESVNDHIRACTACELHRARTQAVPGTGPVTARIMAVGEGPGENEDRQGKPFVGAAGNVLTKLLNSIGMAREDIYITNVVKCRPPANRDPQPEEMDACGQFLEAQLEIIKPDVIIILGRHALMRLLPDVGGISKVHGQKFMRDGRLYVPLYHPAAALHNPGLMRTLEDDMHKVKEYLDDAALRREKTPPAPAATLAAADEQLPLFD